MKHSYRAAALFSMIAASVGYANAASFTQLPAQGQRGVNPDTHLVLRFSAAPVVGKAGQVRIYDAADDRLVDTLDLSIPAGPTERSAGPYPPYLATPYDYSGPRRTNADTRPGTPSAGAVPVPGNYQLTIIGGFTDGFHFHPVIVHDKAATIYPHHDLLEYGKTYYVQVDQGVLAVPDGSFKGIAGKGWRFSTKLHGPRPDAGQVTVSADGKGDFNTVQGAIDFVPERHPGRVTVFVKNGDYEEIVYFRNKSDITIVGEDRDKVRVHYANNEVFNPHPANIGTNELPGTFPSRRAAFAVDHSNGIALVNMTVQTTLEGQAEGLLVNGERNIVGNVTIIGSGDALQANGSAYFSDIRLVGGGDTILGRGPAFFRRCEIESRGAYMWIRNPATNHGNVFVDCSFRTRDGGTTELARLPSNKGRNYPDAEAVLIDATLSGISPAGWGEVEASASNVHFWEFNSRDPSGAPVDVSRRNPASRQLSMEKDAALIASYRDPAFVLGGWEPKLAPIILKQPQAMKVRRGGSATLAVKVAAVPDATYQWFRDGKAVEGATGASLTAREAGTYRVEVRNTSGVATSSAAKLGFL
jgi:pectin methylesterase-like acyl-CoA thioesterase